MDGIPITHLAMFGDLSELIFKDPITQIFSIILGTFVSEDLTCIGTAWLSADGRLPFWVAWTGCFLGIWLGDAGLYIIARWAGRPFTEKWLPAKWSKGESIKKAEEWIQHKGIKCLWITRFVPGTRLPTYLAAGYLRMNAAIFLLITGLACLVWTTLLFWLAHRLGKEIIPWLDQFRWGIWIGLLGLVFLWSVTTWNWNRYKHKPTSMDKPNYSERLWTNWEFWPAWIFYIPVAYKYAALSAKYRSFATPSHSNPGIETGGLVGESKIDILYRLQKNCPDFTAQSWLLNEPTAEQRKARIVELLDQNKIKLPFILKPDTGQRGSGVKLIKKFGQIEAYLKHMRASIVIQEYAKGPYEAGIFYYRFPHETKGHIFAITDKHFPVLTGNGKMDVRELILNDPRASHMRKIYFKRFKNNLKSVPAKGEIFPLVQSGNHAQGCLFKDGMHLYSESLKQQIDEISKTLDGFFIGRYDVRYERKNDLMSGKRFKIVELNGAASEATSIYDPTNKLTQAYRTLFRQWDLVFRIGHDCNTRFQLKRNSGWSLIKSWNSYRKLSHSHPLAD